MARLIGLEKEQAPWHLRWFYRVMHKMFGKDLTPAKQQMRLPGMVWGSIAMAFAAGRANRLRELSGSFEPSFRRGKRRALQTWISGRARRASGVSAR